MYASSILIAALLAAVPATYATPSPMPKSTAAPTVAGASSSDVAILNFALNLECLEAEFYSWAAFGKGLSWKLRGGGIKSYGGMKANLSEPIQAYAEEVALNEIAHVRFLRRSLGDAAVECPRINIKGSFAALADVALGKTLDPPFSPYKDDLSFLLGAYVFEDVGVTAYSGAAPALDSPSVLGAAAGILAVEAYHGGEIRSLLAQMAYDKLPSGVDVKEFTAKISAVRAAVGGGKDKPIFVNGMLNVVPVDSNAVAFARTAAEVLAIVYLGKADTPGGFFPNGINA